MKHRSTSLDERAAGAGGNSTWSFLSHHTHVLVVLARDRKARVRDIAEEVGITQRAVQRILADLAREEMVRIIKQGRRNEYRINGQKPLRHNLESHVRLGSVLEMFV